MNLAPGCGTWIACMLVFIAFTLGGILVTVTILQALFSFLFLLGCLLLLVLLIFFRDPERMIGEGIVAAADGVIREITTVQDPDIGSCTKISTFMNLQNVHVNRMPLDGKITNITHQSGTYLPAFMKESWRNERLIITSNTTIGKIKIVLIAGTLARRIVPYIQKGDMIKKGQRIGLIRLGSRVDVYLPKNKITIHVQQKQRLLAGVSTIAAIND